MPHNGSGAVQTWLQRLRFLGASTHCGRTGFQSPQHPCFEMPGPPLDLRLSQSGSNMGPFDTAHPAIVIVPDLVENWTVSFGSGARNAKEAIHSHVSRYDRYHRHDANPSLREVQPDCGFFCAEIFDPICQGAILASMDIPSPTRIRQSLSVFSFLRMRPGSNNTSHLPAGGWETPQAAVTFLSALQWFITDLIGPRLAPSSFFFICLDYLKSRILSLELAQAWATIDHRAFSAIILFHVHTLWVSLIHWADDCERLDVYYRHGADVLMIAGFAPFSASIPCLDSALSSWIRLVDIRFPRGLLNLANAFRDIIPLAWDHIFLDSPDDASPDRPRRSTTRDSGRRTGDPDRPGSRAWAHNLFEKTDHRDCSRNRNTDLVRAIRPFPRIKMDSGEFKEICFGWACKGAQCTAREGVCPLLHMSTRDRDLRNSDRNSMSSIRTWLRRPAVHTRVRLSSAARQLPCFR